MNFVQLRRAFRIVLIYLDLLVDLVQLRHALELLLIYLDACPTTKCLLTLLVRPVIYFLLLRKEESFHLRSTSE